jgi:tRNA dimethylallyltransferase
VPLLTGGTLLYFKALTEGLSSLPPADQGVRAALDARAATHGWPLLHRELAAVDPATASRLAPTDAQRIQRALEVYRLTGEPLSALQGRRSGAPPELGPVLPLALVPDRARLHAAIAERFDAMLAGGLVEELRALQERYALAPGMPSMRSVGYRQAWEHLAGAIDRATLRERGIAATRQLAKRQYTWLRGTPAAVFDPQDAHAAARIGAVVERALDAAGRRR